jgi:hypothetical protein
MAYYESEILHELIVGEKYSQTQLIIFIMENPHVTVISKSCSRFTEHSQRVHMVLDIIEGYEHKGDRQRTYHVPNTKTKVYILD